MDSGRPKFDQELSDVLNKLADTEEIDVLVYPRHLGGEIERFLLTKKKAGVLDYNILQMANCIVVKAPKKVILEIAARDDVVRITGNPRFTTQ